MVRTRRHNYETPIPAKQHKIEIDVTNMTTPKTSHTFDRYRKTAASPDALEKLSNWYQQHHDNRVDTNEVPELTPEILDKMKKKVDAVRAAKNAEKERQQRYSPEEYAYEAMTVQSKRLETDEFTINLPDEEQLVTTGYKMSTTRAGQLSPITIPLQQYLQTKGTARVGEKAWYVRKTTTATKYVDEDEGWPKRNVNLNHQSEMANVYATDYDDVLHIHSNVEFESDTDSRQQTRTWPEF